MAIIDRPATNALRTSHPETNAPPRPAWLAWLSVVLLVVGLGGGFLLGRSTAPEAAAPAPPRDLAGATVTKFLADYVAVVNKGDRAGIATFYATDATVTSTVPSDPWVVKGNTEIASAMGSWWDLLGFRMENAGTPIQKGQLVMQSHDTAFGPSMSVFQIVKGKIVNQWILQAAK